MIYEFDEFVLDAEAYELRRSGAVTPVEPQVFSLLLLLIENRERMISKDEIIEKVWDGRIVSESALTSRVKSARKALGDDGRTQKYIKTVHGQGFRFIGDASVRADRRIETQVTAKKTIPTDDAAADIERSKPSIAILPFRLIGVAGPYAGIADALPHELISVLSRLRWLLVIARGTSFRFRSSDPDVNEIGRTLNVRYCLTGVLEVAGDKISITVELADTRNSATIWGERFSANVSDVHSIREDIVSAIVAALEIQIPVHEAQAARLKSPDQLDAWAAYHLGLQHLYRFNEKDNMSATAMFQKAIALEPGFARAHAGLSSTHFQNAFVGYRNDLALDKIFARQHAERAIELDPLDPFANFVLGRVHWIENDVPGGGAWLDRAVALSPNFAQGVYARGWTKTIAGEVSEASESVDLALTLSPLDPFRYAMLGVRAFTYILSGDNQQAAIWADKAARSPGAHVLIAAIAVAANEINGDRAQAAYWAANARGRKADLSQNDFFQAFPFEHSGLRGQISAALGKHEF